MKVMSLSDLQIAKLRLDGKVYQEIAEILSVSKRTVHRRCNEPHFLEYMDKQKVSEVSEVVKQLTEEINAETKERAARSLPPLTRVNVLGRLWEIAHIDPSITKGSAQTQKEAASELAAMPELAAAGNFAGENKPAGPDIFKPEWMQ